MCPLIACCSFSDREDERITLIHSLLLYGSDINANVNCKSPLLEACKNGAFKIVQFLLSKGAQVYFEHPEYTPLHAICYQNNFNMANNRNNRRFNNSNGMNNREAEEMELKLVNLLLEQGSKLNAKTLIKNETALDLVIKNGKNQLVDYLFSKGAEANPSLLSSSSLFVRGDIDSHYSLLQTLLKYVPTLKETIIGTTCTYSWKVKERLLGEYEDVNLNANRPETALYWACREERMDMVQLLLGKKASVSVPAGSSIFFFFFKELKLLKKSKRLKGIDDNRYYSPYCH